MEQSKPGGVLVGAMFKGNTLRRIDKLTGLETIVMRGSDPQGILLSIQRLPARNGTGGKFTGKKKILALDEDDYSFPEIPRLYSSDEEGKPYFLNFVSGFREPVDTLARGKVIAYNYIPESARDGFLLEEELNEKLAMRIIDNRDMYLRFLDGKKEGFPPNFDDFADFFHMRKEGSNIFYRPLEYRLETFGIQGMEREIDYFASSEREKMVKDFSKLITVPVAVDSPDIDKEKKSSGWKSALKWGTGILAVAAIGFLGYMGLKNGGDTGTVTGTSGPGVVDTMDTAIPGQNGIPGNLGNGDDVSEDSLNKPREYEVSVGGEEFSISESQYQRVSSLTDEQILGYAQKGAIGLIRGVFGEDLLEGRNLLRNGGLVDEYLDDIGIGFRNEDRRWESRHIAPRYRKNGFNDRLSKEDALRMYHEAILPSIEEKKDASHNLSITRMIFDGSHFRPAVQDFIQKNHDESQSGPRVNQNEDNRKEFDVNEEYMINEVRDGEYEPQMLDLEDLVKLKNDNPYSISDLVNSTGRSEAELKDMFSDYFTSYVPGADGMRIERYDHSIAPDRMRNDMVDMYQNSTDTLETISELLSHRYGMNVSASTISKYARKELGVKGRKEARLLPSMDSGMTYTINEIYRAPSLTLAEAA